MIWIDGVSSVHLIAGLIMQVLATLMIVATVDCKDVCVCVCGQIVFITLVM